ncbi:Crossover junction endodeoxyribonuclease RuvC [Dissostichus eleginoides]|uniref:Crossover junction endodeoxyribonuclease RuvC n=1 Tax=Dissostichus eleginoides TaxID=100907 RepID=A0AAD9F1J6_DISEL|nr:Crossover junction endodeoxyribonuclease RuvC [Dissostichus eleginoides]
MDVSTSSNSTLVRFTEVIELFSIFKCFNLCLCQTAMFATASILTLCVAAAPPLVLPRRLTVSGRAFPSLEPGSLGIQDSPPSPPNLRPAGLASPTLPAGMGHNKLRSLSLHKMCFLVKS